MWLVGLLGACEQPRPPAVSVPPGTVMKRPGHVLDDRPTADCPDPEPGDVIHAGVSANGTMLYWPAGTGYIQIWAHLDWTSFLIDNGDTSYSFQQDTALGELFVEPSLYMAFPRNGTPMTLQGVHECLGLPCDDPYLGYSIGLHFLDAAGDEVYDRFYFDDADDFFPLTICISHFRPDRFAGTVRMTFEGARVADEFPSPIWFSFDTAVQPGLFGPREDELVGRYDGDTFGGASVRGGTWLVIDYSDDTPKSDVWGDLVPGDTGGGE